MVWTASDWAIWIRRRASRFGGTGPRYLRHPEAKAMVSFAQALFDATDGVIATGAAHFEQLCEAARLLPGWDRSVP